MRSGPDYIQLYPTLRCNQSCAFCFNRSLPAVSDMSLASFRVMFDKLKAVSIKTIDVIGGEPTLHPDLAGMISAAIGSGVHVNLSSNGTNISVLEKILKTGDRVSIGLSVNDHGTLKQLSKFIRRYRPIVKSVYTASLDPGLIEEILEHQPKMFYLIYRDAMEAAELGPAVAFPDFITSASSYDSRLVGTVYCSGFITDPRHPELSQVRCPAGTTKLGIMPDGSAYPCNLFFGKPEFYLGNILTDAFESLWNHPVLDFFRTYENNTCPRQSCVLHRQCHGGCPAQAFHLTGDLSAPEPRCQGHRKNLI